VKLEGSSLKMAVIIGLQGDIRVCYVRKDNAERCGCTFMQRQKPDRRDLNATGDRVQPKVAERPRAGTSRISTEALNQPAAQRGPKAGGALLAHAVNFAEFKTPDGCITFFDFVSILGCLQYG
jgi:hypothetical protein